MSKRRTATFGIALLLVLAFASVPAALGSEGQRFGGDLAIKVSYSGDDAYDLAAGGTPELSVPAENSSLVSAGAGYTFSWDHVYAGGAPWLSDTAANSSLVSAGAGYTFSWDHVYAGGAPWLSETAQSSILVAALPVRISFSGSTTYSGDDAYDLAAGGTPELSLASFLWSAGSEIACALSDQEIEARGALSVEGGFSGDDPYDAAAGGSPELSLLPFAGELTLLAACEPISLGG